MTMHTTKEPWNTLKRNSNFDKLVESAFIICLAEHYGIGHKGDTTFDNTTSDRFEEIYKKVKFVYFGNLGFYDSQIVEAMNNINININEHRYDNDFLQEFDTTSKNWLKNNQIFKFKGIDNYTCVPASNTLSLIESFLVENSGKTLMMFPGDYWNKKFFKNSNIEYINDSYDNISSDCCVVITLPNHANQNMPYDIDKFFEICDQLKVPVFIDAIWSLFCTQETVFDLDHNCIHTVAISTRKFFGTFDLRCVLNITKPQNFTKLDYFYKDNRIFGKIVLQLMKLFPSNYVVNKYTPYQNFYAEKLQTKPAPLVISLHCPAGCERLSENYMHDIEDKDKFFCITRLVNHHDLLLDAGVF